MPPKHAAILSCLALLPLFSPLLCAQDPDSDIRTLLSVGPEGSGNAAAAKALASLSKLPPSAIPSLLKAIASANDLSANYLRSAVDALVDRALHSKTPLPQDALRSLLLDPQQHPRARRLAYEILARVAPEQTSELLPSFTNDPSVELRFDAVELLLSNATKLKESAPKPEAISAFRKALDAARHQTQVDKIAEELRALGEEVDLPKHFGFLTHWKVIGPFDNTNLAGFDHSYPPETELTFSSVYDGKQGKVSWLDLATGDDHGKVDLNPVLGELKEVVGYATTQFLSPIDGPAEIRLGCKNGWKVWFNGQLLFSRDEYHRGARMDQYRLPITLHRGPNTLLLKVCQNADVKDWTREWEFQLRICDPAGSAILASDRPPTPPKASPAKSAPRQK